MRIPVKIAFLMLACLLTAPSVSRAEPVTGDPYEVDDAATSATDYMYSSVPEFPEGQRHSFHKADDQDWVRFYGLGRLPFTIRVESPTPQCDAGIELYDGPTTPLAQADLQPEGEEELLTYVLPTTGTYYCRVYNGNPALYGDQTSYTLRITCDTGANGKLGNNGLAIALGATEMECSWDPGLEPSDEGYDLYSTTLEEITEPEPESSSGTTLRKIAGRGPGSPVPMAPGKISWPKVNTSPITATRYVHTGLQPNTTYLYYVGIQKADRSQRLWTWVFAGTTSTTVSFDTSASSACENAGTVYLLLKLSEVTTQPVTVNYSTSGTATAGVDYDVLPGVITFNPGETTKTIAIVINDGPVAEPDETVIVTLTGTTNAVLGRIKSHTFTILNNDYPSRARHWALYR